MTVFTLQSNEIAEEWSRIEPFLHFGVEWTPQFVREELEAGRAQLWGIADSEKINGIVITKIHKTPHTWGLIWIASGRGLAEGISMLLEKIEPWFWEQGCQFIQIVGRDGWKVLPGYKPGPRIFMKVK